MKKLGPCVTLKVLFLVQYWSERSITTTASAAFHNLNHASWFEWPGFHPTSRTGVPGLRLNVRCFCSRVASFQQHDCKPPAYTGCERRFCSEKWTLNQEPSSGSIQKSSEAVRRSEGGEETEAAALRHKLSSDSAELSLLQKLKAKVADFALSSDVKDASL